MTHTWVVGAGGLLGSHVSRELSRRSRLWIPTRSVPWQGSDAGRVLSMLATDFAGVVGDDAWQVVWCAGAGVTGTTSELLRTEATAFSELLDGLRRSLDDRADRGALVVCSSAGGVYGGSRGAPFDEASVVAPISAYGEAKLDLERRAAAFHDATGVPVLVARIANLYGPGQDLAKAQGLVSQLVRHQLLRRPLTVYVGLDTVRDYLYAPDCARLVAGSLARLREEPGARVKVLASEQGVTVGHLVAEVSRLFKRRTWVGFGQHPNTALQARDLRLRSIVWPDVGQRLALTPLPVGIRATVNGQLAALGRGALR